MNVLKEFFSWFISLFKKDKDINPVDEIKEEPELIPEIVNEIEELPLDVVIEDVIIEEEKIEMSEFIIINESKSTYYAPKNVGEKYKNVTINGMQFPDQPIKTNMKVNLGSTMVKEYLPIISELNEYSKGARLLATVMASKEGFTTSSKSYKTNNPGNIGNTDTGATKGFKTLKDGIIAQLEHIIKVANNQSPAYKFGPKTIKPYYSPEIAKNPKTYVISPYLPGYKFDFNGELAGFIKIYATGARGGNGYLSTIISFFKQNGIEINEMTTLKEIININ